MIDSMFLCPVCNLQAPDSAVIDLHEGFQFYIYEEGSTCNKLSRIIELKLNKVFFIESCRDVCRRNIDAPNFQARSEPLMHYIFKQLFVIGVTRVGFSFACLEPSSSNSLTCLFETRKFFKS